MKTIRLPKLKVLDDKKNNPFKQAIKDGAPKLRAVVHRKNCSEEKVKSAPHASRKKSEAVLIPVQPVENLTRKIKAMKSPRHANVCKSHQRPHPKADEVTFGLIDQNSWNIFN